MKIAVIGGGITGLTAAYELTKKGHKVFVFERENYLGGLAFGWKEKNWAWHLEYAYHHLFTSDHAIIDLIRELGISDKLIIKRPVTANLYHGKMYQLDSPVHLLRFPGLSLIDKLRTGALVIFCKINPFWQPLEGITAKQFFGVLGGKRAWDVIWAPLMTGKFGHYDNGIAASWLWARIHKRTPRLCYIEGGFQTFIQRLADTIVKQGGIISTGVTIDSVSPDGKGHLNIQVGGVTQKVDRVLLTVPTPVAAKIVRFPSSYIKKPLTIPHLHAQTLILETDTPILKDVYPDKIGIYWLSVTDRSYPFLAVVAHTNFMDNKQYGGHHLTYIGNYLPPGHPYLSMTKEQLLKKFLPFINKLNPTGNSKFLILNSFLFNGPFAQPVHEIHYSHRAPKLVTPITGVYLANMDSVYPWDRGTNYAVALGQKAANNIYV